MMMHKPHLFTIGAYGFAADSFFAALQQAHVDTFCDIRRRRGVRGAEYAFANSQRLQQRLAALGIHYIYRQELAPSIAIRHAQYAVDAQQKVTKRQRTELSSAFVDAYTAECLQRLDAQQLLTEFPADARNIAFFCVERDPAACHRSLLVAYLANALDLAVTHLTPSQ
ncbi:MAG: DUF488 domain-containing protein [Caldilineaceae bacterium]